MLWNISKLSWLFWVWNVGDERKLLKGENSSFWNEVHEIDDNFWVGDKSYKATGVITFEEKNMKDVCNKYWNTNLEGGRI